MTVYSSFLAAAKKMIGKYGLASTILRNGTQSVPCIGLRIEYRPSEKDGNLIQFTDWKVMVAASGLGIVPDAETDQLIFQGETLRIVTVTKLSPGGEDVLYELQVRL